MGTGNLLSQTLLGAPLFEACLEVALAALLCTEAAAAPNRAEAENFVGTGSFENTPDTPPQPLQDEVDRAIGRLQAKGEARLSAQFDRARLYEPKLSEVFRANQIPLSLLGLGFVESGFKPSAAGKGTLGVWQFQRGTAAKFGLKVSGGKDGRREVYTSTQCLLRYLNFLHGKFHDWLLVVVAFKIGDGNLERALQKNGVRTLMGLAGNGGLAKTTRAYLYNVLAHGILYRRYLGEGV